MPACLSRSVGLSPIFPGSASSLKAMQMEDQSGGNGNRAPASVLRRTLSAAEMCSKMWKPQNGAGIKRTASVEDLQSMIHEGNGSGHGSGSGSEAFEAIWSSIQKKSEAEESEQRKTTDVWGSILLEKDDVAPAPYVHPLVKRSASSLSEKSLEICTESLGSETGSEVFTFLESEKELIGNDVVPVMEADEMMKQEPRQQEVKLTNYSAVAGPTKSKRTVAMAGEGNGRSLPPPLPSLGNRDGGSNVQMRCHRQDGRLVVEAVSVPSRNCFKAERQGGRLLLTFSGKNSPAAEEEITDDDEEEEDEEEVTMSDEESEEVNEQRGIMEKGVGMMTMTKYVDYKFFLTRRSACSPPAPWSHRLNKVVPTPDKTDSVAKSWTPPKAGGAQLIPSLINPYVYSWRSKEMAPRGGGDEAVGGGYGRGGCNGNMQEAPPRGKSLLFWPQTTRARCIATS